MLQRKNHDSIGLQFVKESFWNLVLYLIYFFTLLFWIQFIGVCAQGNRGVFVNNQLFDDSGGANKLHTTNSFISSSTVKPFTFVSSTYRPLSFKVSDSNEFKYSQHSFGINGQVNRGVIVNNQKFGEIKPVNKVEPPVLLPSTTARPPRFGSTSYKPLSFKFNPKPQSTEFGIGGQVNRGVIINNQKIDELQPINRFKSSTITTSIHRSPSFNLDDSNGSSKYSKIQQNQYQVFGSSEQVNRGTVINDNRKIGDSSINNQYANRQRVQISDAFKLPAFVSTTTKATTIKPQTSRTTTYRRSSFEYDGSNEFKHQKPRHRIGVGSVQQLNRGVIINNQKIDDTSNNQYAKLQQSTHTFRSTTFEPPTSTFRTPPPRFRDNLSDYQYFKSQQSNIFKTTSTSTSTTKSPSFLSFQPEQFKLSTFRPPPLKYENTSNNSPYSEWERSNMFKVQTFTSTTTKRPTPLKFDNSASEYKIPELSYSNAPKPPTYFPTSTKSTTVRPQTNHKNDDFHEFKVQYKFGNVREVNRGVIVNNQKFDESKPVNKIEPPQFFSSTTVKPSRFVSSTYRPLSFLFNDDSNDFRYSKPQQTFSGSEQVNRRVITNNQKIDDSSENQYAKPQQTNAFKSSGGALSTSRPSQWPIEFNDSSSAFRDSDFHHSPDTSAKVKPFNSPFSTFESLRFQYENKTSDFQSSEAEHSNIFSALAFITTTPKPPHTFKPTNFNYDDDSSHIQNIKSQQLINSNKNTNKSPTFPLSTYEPVSFVSTFESQAPIHTTKRHTTVHPKTTTSTTTTTAQNVPLSFQGFLTENLDNSTYLDNDADDRVDVDDDEWSSLPIINPPAKKQVLEPEHVDDLFSIENILQRNSSDWEKLDELISKVNETGTLAKVNVLNATKRIDNDIDLFDSSVSASEQKFTYVHPQEMNPNRLKISYEADKDSVNNAKDLKVQFVLDCDLKDSTGSPLINRMTSPSPFNLSPNAVRPGSSVQYPLNMEHTIYNSQRISTTRAPRPLMYGNSNSNLNPNGMYHVPTKVPQQYAYATRPPAPNYYPTRKKVPSKRPMGQSNQMFYYPTKAPSKPSKAPSNNNMPNTMFYYPTKAPSPVRSSAQPNAVYYYPSDTPPSAQSNAVYYFPTKFPVKPTTGKPNTLATTTRKPTKTVETKTTKKPAVKDIYVDPPMVAAISDTFENVYTYFEDALTTKVRVRESDKKQPTKSKSFRRKRGKKRPMMKRSTVVNRMPVTEMSVPIVYVSTEQPNQQRYTQSYSGQNGQKLTANIQVTSEYVGKDPVTERPFKGESSSESDYSSDSYTDEDYSSDSGIRGDDDDDDEGEEEDISESEDSSSSDYGISLGIDDYDDGEESDEDLYDGPPPNKINKRKNKRKSKRPSKKKPSDSGEEDDDDDSSSFSGFSMPNVGSYFQKTFNTISDYIPPLPFTNDDDDDDDDDDGVDDEDEEDSDSSDQRHQDMSIRRPKFKYTLNRIKGLFHPTQHYEQEKTNHGKHKRKRWFDKFFFGSDDDAQTTTNPNEATTEQSKFFDWFRLNPELSTERSVPIPTPSTTPQSWFGNLFSGGSTTPSPKDGSAEVNGNKATPVPNTKIILDMLTAQMANAATKIQASAAAKNQNNGPKRVNYDNYQIWRITPSTTDHLQFLQEYKASDYSEQILWLKGPSMRGLNDVLVPPDMNKELQDLLEEETIPFEVLVWDLEKAIKYENPMMTRRQRLELENEQGHPMTWHRYHNFEDIAIYLDYLQLTYPDVVDLIHIGRSFEGRPLMVIKISFDPMELETYTEISSKKNRPVLKTKRKKKVYRPGIFIEAGAHGREWITPAVATWIIKELIKHNNTEDGNPEKEILRSVDWYIMPISNPDGYEYSLNYDRLWHKTRSKLPANESMFKQALNWLKRDTKFASKTCYGTDPDRNYNIEWRKDESPSPCSDYYEGPKPFSEPESKALGGFLDENKHAITMFISLHSYGQFITYPSTVNANDLRDMAEVAANALRDLASAGRYSVDNSHEMRGVSSGSSADYAMYVSGIKYSYRFELRDTGTQGFLLSPSYIDTTGLEAFEMIKAMVNYL